jgi:hypothetical protein
MKRTHPGIIDKEATVAAGFTDPRSYIRQGKTYLFGADMHALRQRVFDRSRGYCEMRSQGVGCQSRITWETMELHHQPTRAQGGDDSEGATKASCRRCHSAFHARNIRSDKAERRKYDQQREPDSSVRG